MIVNSFHTNEFYTSQLGKEIELPNEDCNHCNFNKPLIENLLENKEQSIIEIKNVLKKTNDEKQIIEALYTINQMLDNGLENKEDLYPILSKFNYSENEIIQTLLAGIYRKIKVPDAFGPLCIMLIKNSRKDNQLESHFDPNEEIGGAILEYIRTYQSIDTYSKKKL